MRIPREALNQAAQRMQSGRFGHSPTEPGPDLPLPLLESVDGSPGTAVDRPDRPQVLSEPPDRDPVRPLKIVMIGLSITSSWGNGHAATYRGLARELHARGHRVLFLERETQWYADNRDLPTPPYAKVGLYSNWNELKQRYSPAIRQADAVLVGSYVQEGAKIGNWVTRLAEGVTAFYDIDTPVTIARLCHGDLDYLSHALVPRYNLYLSFTGGPMLRTLEREFGSPMARALYCSVDTSLYFPEAAGHRWDLGYMGTYSEDRQPGLDELLLEPARNWPQGRFAVAGPQFPKTLSWPKNVKRFTHLSPEKHRRFYNSQKFTLNITRADMIEAGYSPSVRLFEAAACGTPIISDYWEGIEGFFTPGEEILLAGSFEESLYHLLETDEAERRQIGLRARDRVLSQHTASRRARELESLLMDVLSPRAPVVES